MRKKLQPYDRSMLPKNQFVTELGILLAKQTNHSQPVQHHQAVTNLAEYIRVARTHHNLTRSALAQQVGKSEAEIYALEQGLLPYAQIDLLLLCDVAAALGEEVETLILLFGQPALAHTLRKESTHKHGDNQQFGRRRRTISKQIDNWLGTFLGVNLLAKPYRNLVDFWQEGRLLPCIKEKYRLPTGFTVRLTTSAVMLVCLLLFGVSTYSLSTFFDAQSGEEPYIVSQKNFVPHPQELGPGGSPDKTFLDSYTTSANQNNGHVDRSVNLSPIPSTAVVTPVMTLALAQRRARQVAVVPVDPANDQQPTISLLLLPTPNESQRCDWRTNGRFTICRV